MGIVKLKEQFCNQSPRPEMFWFWECSYFDTDWGKNLASLYVLYVPKHCTSIKVASVSGASEGGAIELASSRWDPSLEPSAEVSERVWASSVTLKAFAQRPEASISPAFSHPRPPSLNTLAAVFLPALSWPGPPTKGIDSSPCLLPALSIGLSVSAPSPFLQLAANNPAFCLREGVISSHCWMGLWGAAGFWGQVPLKLLLRPIPR